MAFLTEVAAFFDAIPHGIAWAADPGLVLQAPGPACETDAIRGAVAKRQREFRSGRNLARRVLAGLGHPEAALPPGPGRRPRWPCGMQGSITHCDDLAIAIAGRGLDGLGVDVERAEPLPAPVARHVLTAADRDAGTAGHVLWPTLVFCAKEAFYKAVSHRLPFVPDFDEAAIGPCGGARYAVVPLSQRLQAADLAPRVEGYWTRTGTHLIAVALLPPA